MNWFFIALGAPFLWALVNIFDQYLVAEYSTGERGSGGLVLFSSLIGVFVAFGIWIFNPHVFNIGGMDKILLIITGFITIIWIILYLFTIELEDISTLVPWFLTVPVFGYLLGYVFLGETLTRNQQIGSIIVLLGVGIVSIDFKNNRKFRWKPALYMLVACLLIALSGIIFKYVTVEDNFWISSFWEYVGLGIAGIILYICVPKYRKEFMHMNKLGGKTIFTLNVVSEIMTVVGNMLTNFALLLAPVTMVYLVGSFQPAILLVMTIIFTYTYPNIVKEDMSKGVLIPKIIAIFIMICGSVILFN